MRHHRLNIRLIKFMTVLALLFSLPLITVGRVVLQVEAKIAADQATTHTTIRPVSTAATLSLPRTGSDWPMYLHDTQRTSSTDEAILSPDNVGQLIKGWSFQTGGGIAASATVAAGTVYVGSWDGNEYALDELTGALKWKTYLGRTIADKCYPTSLGITSSAAV